MKIFYKNISIVIIVLIIMFCFSQNLKAIDLDSLKVEYQSKLIAWRALEVEMKEIRYNSNDEEDYIKAKVKYDSILQI